MHTSSSLSSHQNYIKAKWGKETNLPNTKNLEKLGKIFNTHPVHRMKSKSSPLTFLINWAADLTSDVGASHLRQNMKCLKKTHLCIDILGSYYLLINILAKCKIVKPRFLGYAKFQNFLRTLRRQIIKLWLILQLNWSAFIGKLCKVIVKVFKNI